jgi:hypothetical protein
MHRWLQALAALGASPGEAEELLAYNENVFDLGSLDPETRFPLPDEPFVAFWESVVEAARERGAFAVLREHMPQLRFPIREGISRTDAYQAATRRGGAVEDLPEATGLDVGHPERIEIVLHASAAGRIPLLIARGRAELTALIQALTKKNEPVPVPPSQGALMVSGYNNWGRIRELLRQGEEFARITPHRELYQDRFILLSDGPYSAVPAADLRLDEAAWKEMSLVIRREHECTHYFTRRLFGSMRNNLLDELIADYAGITAALGHFRADWCLRFLNARLEIYRGKPPLSDGAFRILPALLKAAAENLERFDVDADQPARIAALASLRLEDLASSEAGSLLDEALDQARRSRPIQGPP